VPRAVAKLVLLPDLVGETRTPCLLDDDDLARHAERLAQKPTALFR